MLNVLEDDRVQETEGRRPLVHVENVHFDVVDQQLQLLLVKEVHNALTRVDETVEGLEFGRHIVIRKRERKDKTYSIQSHCYTIKPTTVPPHLMRETIREKRIG